MSEIYKKALAFRVLDIDLREYKAKQFPIGAEIVVYVQSTRYVGFGIAVTEDGCPADYMSVRLENGNVWNYPIEGVIQNDEHDKWPAWIKRLKDLCSALAFEVDVNDLVCITFAHTVEAARWAGVKSYRAAYGDNGTWPHVKAVRHEVLDKSPLNVAANVGKCFSPEYARTYPYTVKVTGTPVAPVTYEVSA